jgi:hypothetical protein
MVDYVFIGEKNEKESSENSYVRIVAQNAVFGL